MPLSSAAWGPTTTTTTTTVTPPPDDGDDMLPLSLPFHLPTPHGCGWTTTTTTMPLQDKMTTTMTTPLQDKMTMKPSPSPSPPICLQTWMWVDNDDTFARQMTHGWRQHRCYLGFTGTVIYLTFYKTHDVTEEQGLGRVHRTLWTWLISPAWMWTKLFVDLNSTGIVLWQSWFRLHLILPWFNVSHCDSLFSHWIAPIFTVPSLIPACFYALHYYHITLVSLAIAKYNCSSLSINLHNLTYLPLL